MRRWLVCLGSVALLLTLSGSAEARVHAHTFKVVISDMAYGPVPASLHVNDAIVWVNQDIVQHTVTARNGMFDLDLAPNRHRAIVLRKPGEVSFYCRYHPGMTGKLVVAR